MFGDIFIGDAITIDQFQLLIETDFEFGQILSAAMFMNAMYRWINIQCLFDGIIEIGYIVHGAR